MKEILKDNSVECDAFITNREDQPLSWRTPMKCVCMESLGTRAEAAEMIYCPFSLHAAATDMLAYDHCVSDEFEICDFSEVLDKLSTNMAERYPAGVELCSRAMKTFFEITPDVQIFDSAVLESWCYCYDAIATYWAEGLELIDCLPV